MPKTDNSDKWIIVSIFVQPANLKTNLIFGAAWGEAENQDKVDKWINARDLMLPGRGGKRDKMDKWIKQAITRSLLLSASYPRLSTIYPNYPRVISSIHTLYANYPRFIPIIHDFSLV